MDRSQLLRLMPRDKNDVEGAAAIADIGFPIAIPVLRDVIRCLRVHRSPVANLFATLLAERPEHCWQQINHELLFGRDDDIRYVLVGSVISRWPIEWVAKVSGALQMALTRTSFHETDLLCIDLLERHALAERAWLQEWLAFKTKRLERHSALASTIAGRLRHPWI